MVQNTSSEAGQMMPHERKQKLLESEQKIIDTIQKLERLDQNEPVTKELLNQRRALLLERFGKSRSAQFANEYLRRGNIVGNLSAMDDYGYHQFSLPRIPHLERQLGIMGFYCRLDKEASNILEYDYQAKHREIFDIWYEEDHDAPVVYEVKYERYFSSRAKTRGVDELLAVAQKIAENAGLQCRIETYPAKVNWRTLLIAQRGPPGPPYLARWNEEAQVIGTIDAMCRLYLDGKVRT